jgi:hypothetical protein
LRYETNVLVNNFLFGLFVFDAVNQEAQTKGATFHFVSTQTNRLVFRSFQTADCGFNL